MKRKAKDLKLGDVVRTGPGPWTSAIVKQIKDGQITLFRPYGTTADFTCSGGVICYTGLEEYQVPANNFEWELLQEHGPFYLEEHLKKQGANNAEPR